MCCDDGWSGKSCARLLLFIINASCDQYSYNVGRQKTPLSQQSQNGLCQSPWCLKTLSISFPRLHVLQDSSVSLRGSVNGVTENMLEIGYYDQIYNRLYH